MSLELKYASKRAHAWSFLYITVLSVIFFILCIDLIPLASVKTGAITYTNASLPEASSRIFVHGIFTIPEKWKEREVHRSTWMTSPLVCTTTTEKQGCNILVYFVMGIIPNGSRKQIQSENA